MFRWIIRWLKELGNVYTWTDWAEDSMKAHIEMARYNIGCQEILQRLFDGKN